MKHPHEHIEELNDLRAGHQPGSELEELYPHLDFSKSWAPPIDKNWMAYHPRYVQLTLRSTTGTTRHVRVAMYPEHRREAACWYAAYQQGTGEGVPWAQVLTEYILIRRLHLGSV